MEFEARFHRFVSIGDISILNERAFSFFKIKHLLYFFVSILLIWKGLSSSLSILLLGSVLALLGIFSALFSQGSMSLEDKLLATAISTFEILLEPRDKDKGKKKRLKLL